MKNAKHMTANYKRMAPLLDGLNEGNVYKRLEADGFMPLSLNYLYADGPGRYVISMAHNGIQNGDLMADPDMEIRIDTAAGTAEPLTFRNDYLGLYQEVYKTINGQKMYSRRLRTDLDEFLYLWLTNIENQGFIN